MTSFNETIEYYNTNAKQVIESTVNADMSPLYDCFTKYLPSSGRVLDVGCGSGRDSLFFMKQGHEVTAIDAAREMCKAAEKLIGQRVIQMRVEDICFKNEFDGIWACASLLHVRRDQIKMVLEALLEALKDNGVLYSSWKLGEEERQAQGRYFCDFEEGSIKRVAEDIPNAEIAECWITRDVRKDMDVQWINIILKKKNAFKDFCDEEK